MITMMSGEGSDAPIINVFELVTNDLSASNLKLYLDSMRAKELNIFGKNVIPYLINADCAKNIMVAVLASYNQETAKEYIERIIETLRNNDDLDPNKIVLGWCFGHCIRAVSKYSKSNKITYNNIDKKKASDFIIKIWNSVRICENLEDIERRISIWNWFLRQNKFKLEDSKINLDKFSTLNNLEEIDDANYKNEVDNDEINEILNEDSTNNNMLNIINILNKKYEYYLDERVVFQLIEESNNNYLLYFPSIKFKVKVKKFFNEQYVENPLYSNSIQKYLHNAWWKTTVFWSNLVPPIKNRLRRTTATVEIENKIIKTYDIKKRNLIIDEYLYQRINSIKNNQNLVAEKIGYFSF